MICSDEIHNQLLLDERPHLPLACLAPEVAARTVTLMAPSKTYNIAGLGCGYAIVPDPSLRRRFKAAAAMIVPHPGLLAYTAAVAAYRHGDAWLAAQLAYLRRARDLVQDAVATSPGLSMTHVEATYLAWVDCRELDLDDPTAFFEAHGLGFQAGREFGLPGYVRWNFATSHARTREAIARLRRALASASPSLRPRADPDPTGAHARRARQLDGPVVCRAPGAARYLIASSSTSNTSVALGPILAPAPRSP